MVGYFAYEYLRYQESKLDFVNETVNKDEVSFNDVDLMLFDKVIAFDHYTKKIILIVNIKTDDLKANYAKAIDDLEKISKNSSSMAKKKKYLQENYYLILNESLLKMNI